MAIQPHSGTELERSNHFKKSRITSNLEHIVLANDDVIKNRKFSFKLTFTIEHRRKLICKQDCDYIISKKERS